MYRQLADQGVRVPDGFAVTAEAYRHVLDAADAWPALREAFEGLRARRRRRPRHPGAREPATIVTARGSRTTWSRRSWPATAACEEEYGADVSVAVRSTATAEDLPDASFAGQHDSFLNVSGRGDAARRRAAVLRQRCSPTAASTTGIDHGFDHFQVALSVGVMKMVRSDRAAAGVMFTLDTESGFRDVVFVTGAYGLGENVVQGAVDPDEFYVHKPTFAAGHRAVLRRALGDKEIRMVYATGRAGATTRNEPTPRTPTARASA